MANVQVIVHGNRNLMKTEESNNIMGGGNLFVL